ncbi:hypothetical protein K1719_002100 [Acacia pycnantha]|nr:hypothetical protein K1719_002100 [Acacia pycnantha]
MTETNCQRPVVKENGEVPKMLPREWAHKQHRKKSVNGSLGDLGCETDRGKEIKQGVPNRKILKEKEVPASVEYVPKSNMDHSKWQGLDIVDKENLHPRESHGNRGGQDDMDTTVVQVSRDEDPIKSYGFSTVKASKAFATVLRDMRFRYKLDMVVILEPRVSGLQASKVIRSWGFKHSMRREAEGFSGGIWILWELDNLKLDVKLMDEQFIHCFWSLGGRSMFFTAVYANPNESRI